MQNKSETKNELPNTFNCNGHEKVISELRKHRVDLNTPNKISETYNYIPAQTGHALVIAELAKDKAYIPAQTSRALVIAELAKHKPSKAGEKLNETGKASSSGFFSTGIQAESSPSNQAFSFKK